MDFSQTLTITILTAGFTLAGSIITLLINLIKGVSENKHQVKLEKLRIHDADRFKAYSNAYSLLDIISSEPTEPRDTDEIRSIRNIMRKDINPYIAYYPTKTRKLLIEIFETLGKWQIVQNNPDLSMNIDITDFLNEHEGLLKKEVVKILNEWQL